MNHLHDETGRNLEDLLEERSLLNSSLTKNILTKESEARRVQETLRQTQMRLDNTKKDLQRSREEATSTELRLQETRQEKEEMEATMSNLREDLANMETRMRGQENSLTKCKVDLNWAEQSVAAWRSSLTRSEANLKRTTDNLARKERDISDMKKTIQQTQEELRQSQRQLKTLQESQSRKDKELSQIKNSMQQVQEELLESQRTSQWKPSDAKQCLPKSCLEEDEEDEEDPESSETYCPAGWKQIDQRCYYFSDHSEVRERAEDDCQNRGATLAEIHSSDDTLKELIRKDGGSFWIGLKKDGRVWRWSDGSRQENFNPRVSCAVVSPRLEGRNCDAALPWICQQRAHRCRMGMEELRCFGEKTGTFGEKISGHKSE